MTEKDTEPGPPIDEGPSASPQAAAPSVTPISTAQVPAIPAQPAAPRRRPDSISRGPLWVGLTLVFIGTALLTQMFVPQLRLWEFWPVVFIIWGVLVIVRARGRG